MTTTRQPKFPEVVVRVDPTGPTGNVYYIIGAVYNALRKAGHHGAAQKFKRSCFAVGKYPAIVQLARETVTILEG